LQFEAHAKLIELEIPKEEFKLLSEGKTNII